MPIPTGMCSDGVQPSTGIRERSTLTKMFDQTREGVLNDILRRIGIVQHGKRQPIQTTRVQVEQR